MTENISIGAIIFICIWGIAIVGYVMYLNIFGYGYLNKERILNVIKKRSENKKS